MQRIASAEPRPGSGVVNRSTDDVVPWLTTVKRNGVMGVTLGPELWPQARRHNAVLEQRALSWSEIDGFEQALPAELHRLAGQPGSAVTPALVSRLRSFVRMYSSYRNGGRDWLHTQLFRADGHKLQGWEHHRLTVSDGGDRYFEVDFELATGRLFVRVNGDA